MVTLGGQPRHPPPKGVGTELSGTPPEARFFLYFFFISNSSTTYNDNVLNAREQNILQRFSFFLYFHCKFHSDHNNDHNHNEFHNEKSMFIFSVFIFIGHMFEFAALGLWPRGSLATTMLSDGRWADRHPLVCQGVTTADEQGVVLEKLAPQGVQRSQQPFSSPRTPLSTIFIYFAAAQREAGRYRVFRFCGCKNGQKKWGNGSGWAGQDKFF